MQEFLNSPPDCRHASGRNCSSKGVIACMHDSTCNQHRSAAHFPASQPVYLTHSAVRELKPTCFAAADTPTILTPRASSRSPVTRSHRGSQSLGMPSPVPCRRSPIPSREPAHPVTQRTNAASTRSKDANGSPAQRRRTEASPCRCVGLPPAAQRSPVPLRHGAGPSDGRWNHATHASEGWPQSEQHGCVTAWHQGERPSPQGGWPVPVGEDPLPLPPTQQPPPPQLHRNGPEPTPRVPSLVL